MELCIADMGNLSIYTFANGQEEGGEPKWNYDLFEMDWSE